MSNPIWDFEDWYVWMQRTARSSMPPLIAQQTISGDTRTIVFYKP